jgi:S-adenosylmethionine:tRNA ribosyltransferase-isomerase
MLTFEALAELEKRGVEIATLTHAAGLSSVGDPAIDALLPMPERYEIPERTWDAIARGDRVGGVGTGGVRALESAARTGRLAGVADLRFGASTKRRVVDAVLTGVHETESTHVARLGAVATRGLLAASHPEAGAARVLAHEMGDACLVWAPPTCGLPVERRRPLSASAAWC